MSGLRTMSRHHPIHQRIELSDCGHLLSAIAGAVVDTCHRAIRVIEDALDDKARHAEFRHGGTRGPTEIVRIEIGDPGPCANPLARSVLRWRPCGDSPVMA